MASLPQRRDRAHARTREDIIEAAARAFARDGYRATTMQAIAAEAGYTAPSLYSYFASKEKIFDGLVAHLTDQFLEVFDELVPSDLTFAQRLEMLMRRLLELADRRRDSFVVFFSLRANRDFLPPKKGEKPRVTGYAVLLKRMQTWMGKAAPPSLLARHSAYDLAQLLVGISNAFFMTWLQSGDRGDRLSRRTELIVDFFLNGASAGTKRAVSGVAPRA